MPSRDTIFKKKGYDAVLYYVNCDNDLMVRMVANCMATEVPGMVLITGEKLVEALSASIVNKTPLCIPEVKRGLLVMDLDYVVRSRYAVSEALIEDVFIPLLREDKIIWLYGRDHRSLIAHPAFDPVRDMLKEYVL